MKKVTIIAVCCMLLQLAAKANQTLVSFGSVWKYLANGSNQATAWRASSFSDTSWPSGPAQLGYGDGDEATVVPSGGTVKYVTTYFRRSFSIASAATFTSYLLRVKRDDGIVIYVNGTEVYRGNMPTGTIAFNTLASATATDDGATAFSVPLPLSAFQVGTNTVAVEIHQVSTSDSDISFDLAVIGVEGAVTTCNAPTGLSASGISTTGATLNWGAVTGATAYNLQWKAASASTWTTVSNLTTTSRTLTGLSASTSYQFQVQTVCSGGSSPYSTAGTFTTSSSTVIQTNEVIYLWSGAIQPTSATVVAKLTLSTTTARLRLSTSASLSNPIYSGYASASNTNNFMAKFGVSGLTPNTTYYYAVESAGVLDSSPGDIGKFKTPSSGAFSYRFTLGACAVTSNHQAYTLIQAKQPLFHLAAGDFHYANPNSSTSISVHRTPYETNILSQPPAASLFLNVPLAYTWDDHDYCGNNSGGTSAGKTNARLAFQEYVPHYPLAAGSGNVPVYQAFTIGRVHFILTDLRSERTSTSMMGTTQKAWFKNQCLFAKNNNLMIAWVSSVSFGGNNTDNWGGFTAERTELGNWFRDNNIRNMFILSGDAHMVAIDNGANHDFATSANNPNDYPVFQCAALNNTGSNKGGTYSQGVFLNPNSTTGQYGVVDVNDSGSNNITITMTAYRTVNNTAVESQLLSYSFTRNLSVPLTGSMPELVVDQDLSQGIKLSWANVKDAGVSITAKRSSGMEVLLSRNVSAQGTLLDPHPEEGWNTYILVDDELFVLSERRIFMSGRSAAVDLFPVPFSDFFTISVHQDQDGKTFTLLDTSGRVLKQGTIHAASTVVNMEGFTSGIYLLQLGDGSKTYRLVKQ